MELPRPPDDPEAKNIIDKLAQFVARNGPEFEKMTKSKQEGNPKFAFLFGGENYAYYDFKVIISTPQLLLIFCTPGACRTTDPQEYWRSTAVRKTWSTAMATASRPRRLGTSWRPRSDGKSRRAWPRGTSSWTWMGTTVEAK